MQTKKGEWPLLIVSFWFKLYYVKSTKVNGGFGFKTWQLIIIIIHIESKQMNCQYETTRVFKIVTITRIAYEYLVFTHCCVWKDKRVRFFYWLYSVAINHVPLNWMLWKRSYNSAEKIKNNIMEWLEWEHVIEQKKKITNQLRTNGNGIISTNCDERKLKWCYFTGICVSTF